MIGHTLAVATVDALIESVGKRHMSCFNRRDRKRSYTGLEFPVFFVASLAC